MGLLSMSKQNRATAHAPEMQGANQDQDVPAVMLSTEKYSPWKTFSTGKCSPLAAPALPDARPCITLIQSPVPQKSIYWKLKGTSWISSPNAT